jgi:hypothetical protein
VSLLPNIIIHGVVREVRFRATERRTALVSDKGSEWQFNQTLFANDTALLADEE